MVQLAKSRRPDTFLQNDQVRLEGRLANHVLRARILVSALLPHLSLVFQRGKKKKTFFFLFFFKLLSQPLPELPSGPQVF